MQDSNSGVTCRRSEANEKSTVRYFVRRLPGAPSSDTKLPKMSARGVPITSRHVTIGIEKHIDDLKYLFTYAPDTRIKKHPIKIGDGAPLL